MGTTKEKKGDEKVGGADDDCGSNKLNCRLTRLAKVVFDVRVFSEGGQDTIRILLTFHRQSSSITELKCIQNIEKS